MTEIADRVLKGMKLDDILIIDCHSHIGDWKAFHAPCNTAEGMLASMDTLGIRMAFLTAHSSIGPDFRYGNDIVIDAVTRYPGRFIGYATVNPSYADEMKEELDRCFRVEGIKGIKIHPGCHGYPVDHKNYRIAYETANQRKCPILIHVWGDGNVAAVDRLAGEYPEARFIMGHAGAEVKAMAHALEVLNRRPNVYADLAISLTYEGNVEWFVREAGSGKILFGTDMPFFDPRPAFGRVALADISDEEKKDIFGLNIARLLK